MRDSNPRYPKKGIPDFESSAFVHSANLPVVSKSNAKIVFLVVMAKYSSYFLTLLILEGIYLPYLNKHKTPHTQTSASKTLIEMGETWVYDMVSYNNIPQKTKIKYLYLIKSTLLFKKASRAAPFNIPFWSNARSINWCTMLLPFA